MKLIIACCLALILCSCGGSVVTRTKIVPVPVGDLTCPFGGAKHTEYIDSNNNGQLDSDEIRGTDKYYCDPDPNAETTN